MNGLVYIGSHTWHQEGRDRGIGSYRRDSGRLTQVGELETPAPSYLIADPHLPVIYAVNELVDGAVSSYTVDADGGITELSRQSTGGSDPCHLALVDGYLLVANYSSGSVSVHPVDGAGVIGERVDLVRHEGRGPDPERQNGPHAHFVHVDPAGPVTVVDLGLDRLLHMTFAGGRLTPAGETAAPAGAGPRHLVTHPNGYWYVSAELDAAVLSFAVDPQTGWLRNAAIGAATTCTPERPNLPSGIALSPDNRFLYVSNRGPNTISTFQVEEDGTLRAIGEVGTGGDWPRQFSIVDDLLFVANERSHSVVTFRLDPVSGLPEPTGDQLDVPSPVCVLVTSDDR